MKYKIVLPLLLGANLFALNIESAVDIAVQNNYSLLKQKYILEESNENLNGSYSLYRPKVDLNYNYNDRDKLITGQIEKDATLSASITYNLFNGLQDKYLIDSLKSLFHSSKFTYEAKKQDLVLGVKTAYINYLRVVKMVQTNEEAFKSYEKQYTDSKNFFDQGLIAHNELLEVEVEMLKAKQNLQSVRGDQKIAKLELLNLLGNSSDKDEHIEEISQDTETFKLSNESIIDNRSELKALEYVLQNYKEKLQGSYGTYSPRVDASLQHNSYGESADLGGRAGYPDDQQVATLSISWNLYNGGKDSSNIIVYKKKIKQTSMELEDLKQQITLQYKNALEEYDVAKLNFTTASKALEVAKLNYEIVASKLQEGLVSNKDLIDANYLLTSSKENYFDAYYNRYLAIATLERVLEVK